MQKCSECQYGKPVTVIRTGVGASSNRGTFATDGYRCNHQENEKWYKNFYGKTSPKSCPLKPLTE